MAQNERPAVPPGQHWPQQLPAEQQCDVLISFKPPPKLTSSQVSLLVFLVDCGESAQDGTGVLGVLRLHMRSSWHFNDTQGSTHPPTAGAPPPTAGAPLAKGLPAMSPTSQRL